MPDGEIVFRDNGIEGEIGGEVEIADHPTVVGCLLGGGEGNAEYVFRQLLDLVARFLGLVKGRSVLEGMSEVESEFLAVGGDSPPAPLGPFATIDFQSADRFARVARVKVGGNEIHVESG